MTRTDGSVATSRADSLNTRVRQVIRGVVVLVLIAVGSIPSFTAHQAMGSAIAIVVAVSIGRVIARAIPVGAHRAIAVAVAVTTAVVVFVPLFVIGIVEPVALILVVLIAMIISMGGHSVKGRQRLTGKAMAVTTALLLGSVAVAALVLFVVDNKRVSDHQTACMQYRDALTIALADPASTDPIVGLDKSDTSGIRASRATYRTEVVGYTGRIDPGFDASWAKWATGFVKQSLAAQRC